VPVFPVYMPSFALSIIGSTVGGKLRARIAES